MKDINPSHTDISEVLKLLSKRNRTLLIGSFVIVVIIINLIYPDIILQLPLDWKLLRH